MSRILRLVTEGVPDPPQADTEISRTMLAAASDGEVAETFRLHVPGRVVAFGKRDTIDRRYPQARQAALDVGFASVERLAGGRAAVFTEHTLSFAWTIPDPDPRPGITARFAALTQVIVDAFDRLGVPSGIGEIPGEYCPGSWSVHHAGRLKLMGVGQRLARHAAHVGGVIVVARPDLVRRALLPVYRALGLDWDPSTAGALTDVDPAITVSTATDAVVDALAARFDLVPAPLDRRMVRAGVVESPPSA